MPCPEAGGPAGPSDTDTEAEAQAPDAGGWVGLAAGLGLWGLVDIGDDGQVVVDPLLLGLW